MEAALSKIIVQILLTEPFFGHLAAKLLRQGREDIPGLINNMLAHGASVLQVNRITTLLNDYTAKRIIGLDRHCPATKVSLCWP